MTPSKYRCGVSVLVMAVTRCHSGSVMSGLSRSCSAASNVMYSALYPPLLTWTRKVQAVRAPSGVWASSDRG